MIIGLIALVNSGFSQSNNQKLLRSYYRAYELKDWNLLRSVLSPGFRFSSPVDKPINLETYHRKCWPNSQNTKRSTSKK